MPPDSRDVHFASQAKADQYHVDSQISTYKNGPRITRSRAKLLTTLEQRRDALEAPVYRLPDDILQEIFKSGAIYDLEVVQLDFSLTVSWVVSRWRRVALSTAALWTSLKIVLPAATRMAYEKWMTLLSRSSASSRLLDISIALSPPMPIFPLDFRPLKLSETLARCQTLSIKSRGAWLSHYVIPTNSTSMPYPSISNLSLSNVAFRTTSSFLDLLQALPGLVSLKMETMAIDIVDLAEKRIVHLSRLEHLALDITLVGRDWDTHTPLQYLRMPVVQNLLLHGWDGVVAPDMDFSSVTTLSLSPYNPVTPADLIKLICGMPALQFLKLDVIIEDLQSDFPTGVSLPPLASIDFTYSANVETLACWFVEHTASNGQEGTTLKTISVAHDLNAASYPLSASSQQLIRERGVELSIYPAE